MTPFIKPSFRQTKGKLHIMVTHQKPNKMNKHRVIIQQRSGVRVSHSYHIEIRQAAADGPEY